MNNVSWGYLGHQRGMNILYCDYHVARMTTANPGLWQRTAWTDTEYYQYWFPAYP